MIYFCCRFVSLLNENKIDMESKTKFYQFTQNNSGGVFEINEKIDRFVIIEAYDANHANFMAENIYGMYFDGCDQGIDCSCCGDRWSRVDEYDGNDSPKIYGSSALEIEPLFSFDKGEVSRVLYINGDVKKGSYKNFLK